jgi:hypothetical protein
VAATLEVAYTHVARRTIPPSKVKDLLVQCLVLPGAVAFSDHALKEMEEDNITVDEALGVLRSGVCEPGELERGSWRYRVRRAKVYVVVAFRAVDQTVVVTAWRKA